MLRRRTIFTLASALLLAATLAACSSGSSSGSGTAAATAAKSPIVVCGDLALAGPYAQIGETDNWGATAYFHHVNATGGILGHKVDYIVMNNQSSASESELIARKCILSDHAQFIVGPESGADTEAALPIAIAYHTILISLSSGWQTNGYPASELNSWGFPGFYDVFYEDQLASVQQLIVPRHYTRVALLEDNCGSVCLANQGTVQQLASQYGFKLVTTQIDQVGATDVTPQVLAMLAAKPQIILFGLVPGTDSITAIRAIRAQNASIPISECSACELPSFIAAAGGASVMHNIYVLGSMQDWLAAASQGTSAEAKQTAAGLQAYFAGMKCGRLHQRQPARQQPGGLGRRPRDQLGGDQRRDTGRDDGHAEAPAPGHQHAGHRVGAHPGQLREHLPGARRDGGHRPRRHRHPLQRVTAQPRIVDGYP